MLKRTCLKYLAVGLIITVSVAAQATLVVEPQPVNEHRNSDGSKTTPPAGAVDFLQLYLPGGEPNALVPGSLEDTLVTWAFEVYLSQGQVLRGSGAYDFQGEDWEGPGNAYISLSPKGDTSGLKRFEFTTTAWTPWQYEATKTGLYTFSYGVTGHYLKEGYGLFSRYSVLTPVPEPSTWVAGALAGLAFIPAIRSHICRGPGRKG